MTLSGTLLWQLLFVTLVSGPDLGPQHGVDAHMDFRLSQLFHEGCGCLGADGVLAAPSKIC